MDSFLKLSSSQLKVYSPRRERQVPLPRALRARVLSVTDIFFSLRVRLSQLNFWATLVQHLVFQNTYFILNVFN